MELNSKKGFLFKQYEALFQSPFDKLFDVFKELITHTSGDFDEAIDWLRQLDIEYKLTDVKYTIDDFIEDLKKKGYIREELKDDGTSGTGITAKTERAIRKAALDQIFGNLKRSATGNHKTKYSGTGDEQTGDGLYYQNQIESKKSRELFKLFNCIHLSDEVYEERYKKYFKTHYNGKPTKKYLKLENKIRIADSYPVGTLESLMLI